MNEPLPRLVAEPDFRARFTTAEFLRMAEAGAFDDMKVELIDGELERMNPPMNEHARRQMQVVIRLSAWISEERLRAETAIEIGADTMVGCDVAVLIGEVTGNRPLRHDEVMLVVEVAETTLSRDMGRKRIAYATAGIPVYWVVDGARSVVHIYGEPIGGDYAAINTVRFGEPLAVPGTDRTITLD